ncbi:MAG: DUF421 domain-containing protein [Clostridia bacterium]|nr:DUF421 domain-containing protein [Clostridia bacterium]
MVTVLIRCIIIYVLLTVALRLTGKRQVGELQISELITTFMISELASSPIQDLSIPLIYSLVPIGVLLCAEIIMSFVATKSATVKKAFFGNPSIIIKGGILNQGELSRLRISIGELLSELRLVGAGDISKVDYAILEQNGKLSVLLKDENDSGSYTHALVMDGAINESNLKSYGKSENWLRKYIDSQGALLDEIFLLTATDTGELNIIMKEKKK